MQTDFEHSFKWTFDLKSSPIELWPFISDTNKLLKKAGQYFVKKEPFSRDSLTGFLELTSGKISANHAWIEDPYTWEKPYHFGVKRQYKSSLLSTLKFTVDLMPEDNGTHLVINFTVSTNRKFVQYFLTPVSYTHLLNRS